MEATTRYIPGEHPDMKPPIGQTGLLLWLRKNLFSSPFNIVLTLCTMYFLYLIIPPLFNWMFVDSVLVSGSRNECREVDDGACWGFIGKRLGQFTYGFYPPEHRWRVDITFILFGLALLPVLLDKMLSRKALCCFAACFLAVGVWCLFGAVPFGFETSRFVIRLLLFVGLIALLLALWPTLQSKMPSRKKLLIFTVLFPFIAAWLLLGGLPFDFLVTGLLKVFMAIVGLVSGLFGLIGLDGIVAANDQAVSGISKVIGGVDAASARYGMEYVDTDQFGGFMLTLVIGVTGIVFSLPLGILLALGRQSGLHFIRWVCTGFIEFIRGVPLITLLFVASTMLNYFLPPGTTFDLLLRVLIMVTLFSAAYIAEVVRGGLQAIPKGQHEAADAMGLKYWSSMKLVVLPQALKISIPGIVNTFIGLFKDTTLVVIIGLLDPLGIGRAALSDNKWQGLSTEVYVFIALFFFVCCFSMSRYSIYLENKLHTGHRND